MKTGVKLTYSYRRGRHPITNWRDNSSPYHCHPLHPMTPTHADYGREFDSEPHPPHTHAPNDIQLDHTNIFTVNKLRLLITVSSHVLKTLKNRNVLKSSNLPKTQNFSPIGVYFLKRRVLLEEDFP